MVRMPSSYAFSLYFLKEKKKDRWAQLSLINLMTVLELRKKTIFSVCNRKAMSLAV